MPAGRQVRAEHGDEAGAADVASIMDVAVSYASVRAEDPLRGGESHPLRTDCQGKAIEHRVERVVRSPRPRGLDVAEGLHEVLGRDASGVPVEERIVAADGGNRAAHDGRMA